MSERCTLCMGTRTLNRQGAGHMEYMQGRLPVCYDCCSIVDRRNMILDGKATMYLCGGYSNDPRYEVKNWPGSLVYKATKWAYSTNNWGCKRTDVWFNGPDGYVWWGFHVGGSHELINIRRTRERT